MHFIWLFLLLHFTIFQCYSQPPVYSTIKDAQLYAKGKRQTTVGAIIVGTGVTIGLTGLTMQEKQRPSNGWNFLVGPSDKEALIGLGVLVAAVGMPFLLSGLLKGNKARVGLRNETYWKAPGQRGQMPVLSFPWQLGKQSPAVACMARAITSEIS